MDNLLIKMQRLKEQMLELGPMLPGSISEQWNTCGSPGCQCKNPKHPKKHGPYYQLSFSIGGKSSSMFVKTEDLIEAQKCIMRYKKFKKLSIDLIQLHVELTRTTGFTRKGSS